MHLWKSILGILLIEKLEVLEEKLITRERKMVVLEQKFSTARFILKTGKTGRLETYNNLLGGEIL